MYLKIQLTKDVIDLFIDYNSNYNPKHSDYNDTLLFLQDRLWKFIYLNTFKSSFDPNFDFISLWEKKKEYKLPKWLVINCIPYIELENESTEKQDSANIDNESSNSQYTDKNSFHNFDFSNIKIVGLFLIILIIYFFWYYSNSWNNNISYEKESKASYIDNLENTKTGTLLQDQFSFIDQEIIRLEKLKNFELEKQKIERDKKVESNKIINTSKNIVFQYDNKINLLKERKVNISQ